MSLMDPRQAAKFLNVSERSLWTLTKVGRVRSAKIGRLVRYDEKDLRAFVESCKGVAELSMAG